MARNDDSGRAGCGTIGSDCGLGKRVRSAVAFWTLVLGSLAVTIAGDARLGVQIACLALVVCGLAPRDGK